jgi:hypothetical protein
MLAFTTEIFLRGASIRSVLKYVLALSLAPAGDRRTDERVAAR